MFIDHLNLAWNWLLKIRFCQPSVDFSISKRADTDPAARLLDGWQEGVVPLVLQKALWTEAETEGEPSFGTKQSRAELCGDRLSHCNPLHATKNRLWFYIRHTIMLFRCYFAILRSASILMASQHGCLSMKLPPGLWSFLLKLESSNHINPQLVQIYRIWVNKKRLCTKTVCGKDLLRKMPKSLY